MAALVEEVSAPMAVVEAPRSDVFRRGDTAFGNIQMFEDAQRMAKMMAASDLVPKEYRGNIPNCVLALEIAQRIGASPLMVMQNLYIVHGKPAWSSQFLIACVNSCGNFSPLRYELTGKEGTDARTCIAWAYDKATNERLESPPVSIAIAKAEGWYQKNGSKWQTMPELMLRYRTATFFARTYSPELTMGMKTEEELKDIDAVVVDDEGQQVSAKAKAVRDKLHQRGNAGATKKEEKPEPEAPQQSEPTDEQPEVEVPPLAPEPEVSTPAPEPVDGECKAYTTLKAAWVSPRTQPNVKKALEIAAEAIPGLSVLDDLDPTDDVTCGEVLLQYRRRQDAIDKARGK